MTEREALIEALNLLQGLHRVVQGLAERVQLLEQVVLLTPNPREEALFNQVAAGYQRECEAKELRLTDEQVAEIEAEIESKNTEEP